MRWVAAGFLVFLFLVRVFICQGWYIVCYALGIYHLNLFIAFLTPKIDPALDLDGNLFFILLLTTIFHHPLFWFSITLSIFLFIYISMVDDQGPELPTRSNQEFRPFIRRLPEFKFWYAIAKSTVIGIICTFFEVFNIPVFWPILVMYFITLFCITMKRQIKVSDFNHSENSDHFTNFDIFLSLYLAYDQIQIYPIHGE